MNFVTLITGFFGYCPECIDDLTPEATIKKERNHIIALCNHNLLPQPVQPQNSLLISIWMLLVGMNIWQGNDANLLVPEIISLIGKEPSNCSMLRRVAQRKLPEIISSWKNKPPSFDHCFTSSTPSNTMLFCALIAKRFHVGIQIWTWGSAAQPGILWQIQGKPALQIYYSCIPGYEHYLPLLQAVVIHPHCIIQPHNPPILDRT